MSSMFDLRGSLVWSQTYAAVMQAMITKLPADAADLVDKASSVAFEAANQAVEDFDTAQEEEPPKREAKIRELAAGLRAAMKNSVPSYAIFAGTKTIIEVTETHGDNPSTFQKEMDFAEIKRGGIEAFRLECAEALLELRISNGELDRKEYGKKHPLTYSTFPMAMVKVDPETGVETVTTYPPAALKLPVRKDPGTVDLGTVDPT